MSDGHGPGHGHGASACFSPVTYAVQVAPLVWPKCEDHGHAHGPRFSDAVPSEFAEGFADVWEAVAHRRMPAGVTTDCQELLKILLQALDGKTARPDVPRGFLARLLNLKPREPDALLRLRALKEKGLMMRPVIEAAERLDLRRPAHQADHDYARRFMGLIWQIADQGFEQKRWSTTLNPPPRWTPDEKH